MASYNELNALIDAYINRNGVQAITGQILNGVLKAMVEQLGRGYTIMGAAIPTTDPGTPDGPECYFASETGTYTDFDGLQVVPGELALLCYIPSDGWTKATIYEGFQEVGATVDGNVGTPSVGVSYANGVLSFDFHNMKGNPGQNGQDGQDGDPAGFGTIGADITGGVGTPGVTVESSGPATAKNLQFHFTNLKGETGVTSVVATVDNTTGTPACTVSLVGQQLTLAFTGLKGAQGNTGSSVDYPFTIVNNLTTDDATQALSAAQGKVLDGKVSQLQQKVDGLIDDLSEPGGTVYVELTAEDADNTFSGKYLMANGGISSSTYYDTYCKGFPEGGKIQYSVGAANLGLFTADSNAQVGTRTKIAYYGDADGTFDIPAGKYLFWDVLKSDPSKISIKVETVIPEHLKDFATMEDLEPVQEAITTFAPVAGQIAIDKIEVTATGTTTPFSKFVDLTTDKPFRISVELLSGSRKSNVDFYVSLYYSDAPSTQVVIKHNSFGFDESAWIVPAREISKILIYSPSGFLESSQVKFTISFDSDLWTAIRDERKPWTGKKIVTFGDSITELNDGAYMSWPDHFARTTGATVINLGLGGTRIKPRTYEAVNTTDWAYSQVDILNAVKAVVGGDGSAAFDAYESGMQYIYDNVGSLIVDKANILRILEDARSLDLNMVDAFVIFAGFNDWFAERATKEEVFASLVELVQTVSSTYPNVQIYYCTPMPSFIGNVVDAEHFNLSRGGVTQEAFCAKMAEIGNGATQVNVFDAFHKMGINAYNGLFYYRSNDGVHPWGNTKTVGRKIGAWINSKYCI